MIDLILVFMYRISLFCGLYIHVFIEKSGKDVTSVFIRIKMGQNTYRVGILGKLMSQIILKLIPDVKDR